jgi:FtsZ-interacting cell division protein ZipA
MQRRQIASILFFVATFPVDYLVYTLLPSISTIIIAIITIALLVIACGLWFSEKKEGEEKGEKRPSEVQKSNFRNRVENEIISILEGMNNVIVVGVGVGIPYSIWNSITDYEKIQLLGDDDYRSINTFYHAIDESNRVTQKGDIQNAISGTSYQPIIKEAERIFNETSWLRPKKEEMNSLFSALKSRYNLAF